MRAPADRARLERFLQGLGRTLRRPIRLYLVGGAVLVDLNLRYATLDVDFVARAEDPEALADFERCIPRLKEELNVNVEPASPEDFMPVPRAALDQSPFVRMYGNVAVDYYHLYHLPSLVLAKAARSAERDLDDIERLVRARLVPWQAVEDAWSEVRTRDTGWLRHTPAEVEGRLEMLRRRLASAGLLDRSTDAT